MACLPAAAKFESESLVSSSLLTVSCGHAGLGALILAAACMLWMYALWRQLLSTQKQLASKIQRLHDVQVTNFPTPARLVV